MCGTALRAIRKVPLTLVTITFCQISGSDSQNLSDFVLRRALQMHLALAGIVDQHMEHAEFIDRLRDHALAIGAAGDVAMDAERAAALRLTRDRARGRRQRVAVDIREHHVGAGAHEARGHRLRRARARRR